MKKTVDLTFIALLFVPRSCRVSAWSPFRPSLLWTHKRGQSHVQRRLTPVLNARFSWHDFERDPTDNQEIGEDLDMEAINLLLSKYTKFKYADMAKDCKRVLKLLSEDYGVYVDDDEMLWSTSRHSGRGTPQLQADSFETSAAAETGATIEKEPRKRTRDFGAPQHESKGGRITRKERELQNDYKYRGSGSNPNSHDLNEMDLNVILELIAKRTLARERKEYEKADVIQETLSDLYSVGIDDGKLEWFTLPSDDNPPFPLEERKPLKPSKEKKSEFQPLKNSNAENNDVDKPTVSMKKARSKQGEVGEHNDAGFNPLSSDGGYDEEESFTLDEPLPQLRAIHDSYRKAHGSRPLPPEDEEYVTKRIKRLAEADKESDYDTSHAIRTELKTCYDVHFEDVLGVWSVGGNFYTDAPEIDCTKDSVTQSPSGEHSHVESAVDDAEVLGKLTVPLLKEKLRDAGLPVSGRKSELIERLVAAKQ